MLLNQVVIFFQYLLLLVQNKGLSLTISCLLPVFHKPHIRKIGDVCMCLTRAKVYKLKR